MMKVEIAFDLSANGLGNFFTLDDSLRGVLDNTLYTLGGDVFIDVTDTVRSVSIKRGRNRQLEKFTAGNANIILDNRSRVYDPTNTVGPYYNQILPRKRVRITDQDQVIYTGQVADWNFSYDVSGDSTAQVSCVDALTLLVEPVLTAGTETAQLSGARVAAVLDDIAWPTADRRISVGQVTLDDDVIGANVKALDYLNKVALSDPGALFVGADGFLVFLDRADLQNASNPIVFGTGGIPFTDIQVEYGIEELSNQVSVTYYGGTAVAGTAVAIDETSVGQFGLFEADYNTLLASDADAQALADFQVARYSQPQYRVDTVTVALDGLGTATQQTVLGLDLGAVATVTWTPNGVGAALSQTVTIDHIDFAATPASRSISFTMSETAAGFILDDSVFGVLDTSALAF
jgi:hypothetical protein